MGSRGPQVHVSGTLHGEGLGQSPGLKWGARSLDQKGFRSCSLGVGANSCGVPLCPRGGGGLAGPSLGGASTYPPVLGGRVCLGAGRGGAQLCLLAPPASALLGSSSVLNVPPPVRSVSFDPRLIRRSWPGAGRTFPVSPRCLSLPLLDHMHLCAMSQFF